MRKHQTDKKIFIATFVLILVGTIMVSIVGPSYTNLQNIAYGKNIDPNSTFKNQIVYVVLSFLVMIAFLKVPLDRLQKIYLIKSPKSRHYQLVRKIPEIILGISLIMCLFLAVGAKVKMPFVHCALGGCRWLNFGVVQLQVAEFLKFGALLYFAKICAEYRLRSGFIQEKKIIREEVGDFLKWKILKQQKTHKVKKNEWRTRNIKKTMPSNSRVADFDILGIVRDEKEFNKKEVSRFWLKYLVILGLALYFIVIEQKDLGSALPLVAIAFLILLESGVNLKIFIALIVVGVGLAGVAILKTPHRLERLATFNKSDSSKSYHIDNALIAIGSGGLFGVGIGNNVQTAGYLPESITDSMFAVICETVGFVGAVIVLGFYWLLLSRMLKIADCTKDSFYQLVTIGVFAWIGGHVVINIAAMTGLVPVTGIPLPLLSKGGTNLIFVMATIGLVLNISQYTARMAFSDTERIKDLKRN